MGHALKTDGARLLRAPRVTTLSQGAGTYDGQVMSLISSTLTTMIEMSPFGYVLRSTLDEINNK
jgi:hypothetical protein